MFERNQDLCDVVSILVQCVEDKSFYIVRDQNSEEVWIPSARVTGNASWKGTAKKLLSEVQLSAKPNKICKIVKAWKPYSQGAIHHVVFHAIVPKSAKTQVSPPGKKAFWQTANEVQMNFQKLQSPELLNFLSSAQEVVLQHPKTTGQRMKIGNQPSWTTLIDEDPVDALCEILESHVLREDPAHRNLMECGGFTNALIISVYCQFLVSCFPATYMNARIFRKLFSAKFGWDPNIVMKLFNTADLDLNGFLSFRDFMYIVAVTDPNMKHGVSEIRSKYIFRYYDANCNKLLEYNEIKALQNDIKMSKTKNADTALLSNDLDSCAKALGVDPKTSIDVDKFVKVLATPRLKGTAVLLRSSQTVANALPAVQPAAAAAPKRPSTPATVQVQVATPSPISKSPLDYVVAVHCIKLKNDGTLIDKIWNIEDAMSETSLNTSKTQLAKSPSMYTFNQNNVHFEVLRGLEYFEKEVTAKEASLKPGKKQKAAFNWGMVDPTGFARCVMKMCEQVTAIFKKEARLLELVSPVYVLGDMHGSFVDLMRFEKALWPLGPTLSPTTLLVLGDYVDRGPHSIELIAYLFAYKLQSPQKLMLIRGNHEIRAVQCMFTFLKECCHKFGEKLGNEVWETVNTAMDCLPLAAVIDGKVFCSHGGIPPPWLCPTMSVINTVPCPLPRPDEQSPLAWDLMWNDPIKKSEITPAIQMELNANEGFATNTHRGTGHFFTENALFTFLRTNSLSMLLRAHQMQNHGFYVQMRSKMETVFSASRYGKANNEAACILVDNGRLRAYRVELKEENRNL